MSAVRSRRNRPGNRRMRNKHFVRSVHRIELGTELKPSVDPPAWISAPWWPLTVTSACTKPTSFSPVVIHALVLKSLDLDTFKRIKDSKITDESPAFRYRFVDIRVWGLAKQPLTLNIPRLNSIGTRVKQLNDLGSAVNYSRLGWRFGLDSQLAVDYSDTDEVFSVSGSITGAKRAMVYIRLMIQRIGVGPAAEQAALEPRGGSPEGFEFMQV